MTEPNDEDRMRVVSLNDRHGLGLYGAEHEVLAREFAAVRAAERERCAKVCESHSWSRDVDWWREETKKEVSAESARQCAAAIREGK